MALDFGHHRERDVLDHDVIVEFLADGGPLRRRVLDGPEPRVEPGRSRPGRLRPTRLERLAAPPVDASAICSNPGLDLGGSARPLPPASGRKARPAATRVRAFPAGPRPPRPPPAAGPSARPEKAASGPSTAATRDGAAVGDTDNARPEPGSSCPRPAPSRPARGSALASPEGSGSASRAAPPRGETPRPGSPPTAPPGRTPRPPTAQTRPDTLATAAAARRRPGPDARRRRRDSSRCFAWGA